MTQVPEISYIAIGLIARFPAAIPIVAAASVAGVAIVAWGGISVRFGIGVACAAALTWFLTRLLVEIVVVLADTLLPR